MLASGQGHQLVQVCQCFEIADPRDQVLAPSRPEHRFDKPREFFLQSASLKCGIVRRETEVCRALTREPSVRTSSISAKVFGMPMRKSRLDLITQPHQLRVRSHRLGICRQPAGINAGKTHRGRQTQRELRFQTGTRCRDIANPVAGFLQRDTDAVDAVWRHAELLAQFPGRLDRGMDHVACRVVLEEIALNVPTARRRFQCAFRMEIRTVSGREALLAFDDVGPAGESAHRQFCRDQIRGTTPCPRAMACTSCRTSTSARRPGCPRCPVRWRTFPHPAPTNARTPPPRRNCRSSPWHGNQAHRNDLARPLGRSGTEVHSRRRTRSGPPPRTNRVPRASASSAGKIATDG